MANGSALTADYQFQLHDNLYGRGQQGVSLDAAHPIEGLGVPDAKSQDVVKNYFDGSFGNADYAGVRVVTIPVVLRGGPTTAMGNLKALTLAWIPVATNTDLYFQLPGWGKFGMMGRPRGIKADLTLMRFGAVHALLRFDALDPTITYI